MDGGTDDLEARLRAAGFIEILPSDTVVLDIRYATADNFLGRPLYGDFDRLYLHPIAAGKLHAAVANLERAAPDTRLCVFDGLRPNRIQRLMWEAVRGTPQQIYVGDPAVGSIHGFGLAVDLTLVDRDGREFDMGTPFDDFTPLSEPRREAALLTEGALTATQIENRLLLRRVMTAAGFHPLPIEWWHFDALPAHEVRGRFQLIE